MAVVMKWCDTENQYMANFEDDASALANKHYELNDEGIFWDLKDEQKTDATYSTKEMKPAKKAVVKKKKSED